MGNGKSGVRRASDTTIEIDFYFRSVRCRERLKLEPTPRNLKWAEAKLGQIQVEIGKGTFDYLSHFPRSRRAKLFEAKATSLDTVERGLWAWYARREADLQHTTLIDYKRAIQHTLVPAFGKLLLREFTRADAKAWVTAHPALTPKRINNVLSPLRQMFAEAVDDEVLASNPMADLVIRRRQRIKEMEADDIDPFTPSELKAILEHSVDPQFRNMVAFAVGSGLRWPSEVIALRWADVDLDAGTVRVRAAYVRKQRKVPKTAAGNRTVQLATIAREALLAQRQHTLLKKDVVFERPDLAKPRAWSGDKEIRQTFWQPALKRAGVRYRPCKQLRHTYASTMLSAGEPLRWVSFQIGHVDPSVTARVYSRFIAEVAPDAGNKGAAAWSAIGQQSGEEL